MAPVMFEVERANAQEAFRRDQQQVRLIFLLFCFIGLVLGSAGAERGRRAVD